MSADKDDPSRPPRRRTRASITLGEVLRNATPEQMDRPAAEVLASITWEGAAPDPEILDAATYLAWL